MTKAARLATFETYQSAWRSNISMTERQGRLEASVAEDCVYCDPGFECRGYAELLVKMDHSKQHFPGATFRVDTFLEHHDVAVANWTMFDGKDAEFVKGASYARFGEDGRLTHMTGFFEPPATPFQPGD